MLKRLLCRLFGHPGFSKNWLVVEDCWENGEEERKEYLGERCVRCKAWRHPEMNLRFGGK